jgi:two-component system nitrogen regulation response regulator GlnG
MAELLLIDDDAALTREQVRRAFPAPAHTVAVARTGADGVAHVRAQPPDVILLDLRLPDQSGLNVYRQIRAIDGRIPVIFVTMVRTAEATIEAIKEGAYD